MEESASHPVCLQEGVSQVIRFTIYCWPMRGRANARMCECANARMSEHANARTRLARTLPCANPRTCEKAVTGSEKLGTPRTRVAYYRSFVWMKWTCSNGQASSVLTTHSVLSSRPGAVAHTRRSPRARLPTHGEWSSKSGAVAHTRRSLRARSPTHGEWSSRSGAVAHARWQPTHARVHARQQSSGSMWSHTQRQPTNHCLFRSMSLFV